MSMQERLADIRARMKRAAVDANRDLSEITLIAVAKYQPIEKVIRAFDLGVRDFGDNTAQNLIALNQGTKETGRSAHWHFIGRLQRNKINKLLPIVHKIHTVDRMEVAEDLSKKVIDGPLRVLVQVNIGKEPQKGGVEPEYTLDFALRVAALPGLKLTGLMAIPPFDRDPMPYFVSLKQLSARLQNNPLGKGATDLSMGMSDDFEKAIRCGSTMVRVGTALFGERQYPLGQLQK